MHASSREAEQITQDGRIDRLAAVDFDGWDQGAGIAHHPIGDAGGAAVLEGRRDDGAEGSVAAAPQQDGSDTAGTVGDRLQGRRPAIGIGGIVDRSNGDFVSHDKGHGRPSLRRLRGDRAQSTATTIVIDLSPGGFKRRGGGGGDNRGGSTRDAGTHRRSRPHR